MLTFTLVRPHPPHHHHIHTHLQAQLEKLEKRLQWGGFDDKQPADKVKQLSATTCIFLTLMRAIPPISESETECCGHYGYASSASCHEPLTQPLLTPC